ncbi:MAG: NAD/NADP octopine/nopaline dehydrogenase family protein [Bacillota bacterium]
MSKIAILGAGNAGQALAADCKLANKEVRLFDYDEYYSNIAPIMKTKKIELYGPERNGKNFKRNGIAQLDVITTNLSEAVKDADIIAISIRALGYERLFRDLIPFLEDGQIVTIFPDNYGSLILRRLIDEVGCKKDVIIGGWSSLPYGARITELGEINRVYIMYRAINLRYDTLPSRNNKKFLNAMKELPPLDSVDKVLGDTVLDIGFSNVNPILHVPATIMNVGTIDNWGIIDDVGNKDVYYDIYRHGFSYNVGKIQWEIYQEEVAIANAVGVGIQPYEKEVFFSRTSILGPEFMGEGYAIPFEVTIPIDDWMKYLPGERFSVESRYITEDIPVSYNVYYQLAKKFGVKTPTIESMINLASIVSGKDYYKSSFNLEFLGIANMNKEELKKYLTRT